MAKLLLTLLLCLSPFQLTSCFIPHPSKRWSGDLPETFNWSSIEPSGWLRYHSCYDGLECARWYVPRDWTHLTLYHEVALAVARLLAKVPESDPAFGGTIVLNPGGPSGSGVDILRWAGREIQEIVDGEKHFEILSFDPRGTKYSTPSASCFEEDEDRDLFLLQNAAVGSVDDSKLSLDMKWALAEGLGKQCASTNLGTFPDGTNIRQYVSTAQVAYDMLRLTDAIEEHRLHALENSERPDGRQEPLNHEYKMPLLNYWGYSYGSYLGNTYASMFPGRVGRMILDGVVDAPDYAATGWTANLDDNDKVWLKFFEWCFAAGSKCALYDSNAKGPNELAGRLDRFIDHLIDNPLSIVYNDNIYLFTYFNLQAQMHYCSYGPYQTWPLLAIGLSSLLQGDPTTLLSLTSTLQTDSFYPSHLPHPLMASNFLDPFNNRSTPWPPGYPHSLEASTAILCGDGADITSSTKRAFKSYLQHLKSQSTLVGPIWAQITLFCRHWPVSLRPAERNRFAGPFTSRLSQYQNDSRASPLLFIGNTADPVTPLRNAIRMAARHEGARVLVQDAPGHCAGVNTPSECTWGVIREFFNEGRLPEEGKVCAVDWLPWDRE